MSSSDEPVLQVGSPGAGAAAWRVVGAAVALLAVAVLKPWGATPVASPKQPSSTPAPVIVAVDSATSAPGPTAGPGDIVCGTSGWRVVSINRLADWTVRTWMPAVPVPAAGPADPTIPTIELDPGAIAVGICGPGDTQAGVGSSRLVIGAWRGDGLALQALAVSTGQAGSLPAEVARLYAPAPGSSGAGWPAGRFVLELAGLPGGASGASLDDLAPRYLAVSVSPTLG
jgi:hypothetical protein